MSPQAIGEPCPDYVDCITTHADLGLECCKDPCGLLGEYNRANNEHNYARRLLAAMKNAMPTSDHLKVVVDTGRNGNPEARTDCGSWCNARDASIGKIPTYDTLDPETLDAYYWLKTPGESDGCTELLPNPDDEYVPIGLCPRFDQGCASVDSLGTHVDEPYAPEAGQWYLYQIQMLAEHFYEWRDLPEYQDPDSIVQRNLFAEYDYYVNPIYSAKVNGSLATETDPDIRSYLKNMANLPTAIWIDAKDKIYGTELGTLEGTLRAASTQNPAPLCVFVLYNLPNRNCRAKSAPGELCCTYNLDGTCDYENSGSCEDGLNEYRFDFVDPVAEVLSNYDGVVPIVVIIEPDALPDLIVSTDISQCNNYGTRNTYLEGVKYAIGHIDSRTENVAIYIDGSNGGQLGWSDYLDQYVQIVWGLGLQQSMRGFALNVAGYQPLGSP